MLKLSILIPVYNEERTIARLLDRVLAVDLAPRRRSSSSMTPRPTRTRAILDRYRDRVLVLRHDGIAGKGRRCGRRWPHATGDFVVPQDADLEYEPADLKRSSRRHEARRRVVYGSRRLHRANKQYSALSFYLGGVLVTWVANLLYGLRLTDEPTCYKLSIAG